MSINHLPHHNPLSQKNIAQSVVLYGPKGCGKTTNATRISKALNLPRIVEFGDLDSDTRRQRALPEFGVLLITDDPDAVAVPFRRLAYDLAMKAVAINEGKRGAKP